MSIQETFNKLKHALENDYAIIPIADYQAEQQELAALRQLKLEMEVVESWLRRYDFEHAEIMYDYKEFIAQTSLEADGKLAPRMATGGSMIEAVKAWKAKYEGSGKWAN